jgi:hypothetical protein
MGDHPAAGFAQPDWTPSVYHAECCVECTRQQAWHAVLDYTSWNPDFANAEIIPISGKPGMEGELVLMKLRSASGDLLAEFHSQTVRIVPETCIVWYVHPKEGTAFRNFVDFSLEEAPAGVRFSIRYYAQNPLSGDPLRQQRQGMQAGLEELTRAFQRHCAQPPRS